MAGDELPGTEGQRTNLPFVPLCFYASDFDLEVLLGFLCALDFLDELLLEFLAGCVEFVELSSRFCEHIRDLIILCFPVCGGRIAGEGVSRKGGGREVDTLDLVVVKGRHYCISA